MTGPLWMALAQALFALMNLGARAAAREVSWMQTASVRFLVGMVVAWGVARATGKSLRVTDRKHTWLRTVFGTLSAFATFFALSSPRLPLGDAATLGATSPIFIALLAGPLLGERVGRGIGIAIAVAFGGAVLLLRPTFSGAADVALIATAGALAYALAMISLRRLGSNETGEAVVFHFSTFGFVTTLLLALPRWVPPSPQGWLALAVTGLSAGAAQLAMTRAYALDRAARIGALGFLSIALTYLAAIPLLGEHPTAGQLAGAALVITGGLLVGRSRVRPGAHAPDRKRSSNGA